MLLDEKAYLATMAEPMTEVDPQWVEIDIWPYVGLIPEADLQGFAVDDGVIERVYRTPNDRFDHVLVPTRTANVFLVIIVSRINRRVRGHHLLNLNDKYGLPTPDEQ